MTIQLEPIGTVRGGRTEVVDDNWGGVKARIELDAARFTAESLAGLDSFSHVMVVYYFHRADPAKIELTARHPRNNPAWPKIGIFAQRGKNRPNLLGVSTCQVLGIDGNSLLIQGLDAVDGTPVVDLKPLMKGFEPRGSVFEPVWAGEIMANYW
ncbi:MAG TPA: SAM-dependent methyltransferase [Lacunisphaera sp.]|jgi:tRNA-Thr(GGU) m(6)t(6)A37 methyltransferase TsaA